MNKIIILTIALSLSGCTDAFWDSTVGKLGVGASIKCYSGTMLIYEGESTGAIKNATNSDGYQFRSKETGKFLEVSGNCILAYKE